MERAVRCIHEHAAVWTVSVACSAVWCATGWSRKAANEARPWWRRGSSSWKWVSGVDKEKSLFAIHAQRRLVRFFDWLQVAQEMRGASHIQYNSSHAKTAMVFKCTLSAPDFISLSWTGVTLIWLFFWRLSSCFFSRRSSKLRRNQTVDVQDCLQTPVCAEAMQP